MKSLKWIGSCTALFLILNVLADEFACAQSPIPPPLQRGIAGKTKGQVVALQNDAQIVAWCDFDKHIVVTATNVLCVYNGGEESTPTPTASAREAAIARRG